MKIELPKNWKEIAGTAPLSYGQINEAGSNLGSYKIKDGKPIIGLSGFRTLSAVTKNGVVTIFGSKSDFDKWKENFPHLADKLISNIEREGDNLPQDPNQGPRGKFKINQKVKANGKPGIIKKFAGDEVRVDHGDGKLTGYDISELE